MSREHPSQADLDPRIALALITEIHALEGRLGGRFDTLQSTMHNRFEEGSAQFGNLNARVEGLEERCQDGTKAHRKKEMNPVVLAMIVAAISGPVTGLSMFLLTGAAKSTAAEVSK